VLSANIGWINAVAIKRFFSSSVNSQTGFYLIIALLCGLIFGRLQNDGTKPAAAQSLLLLGLLLSQAAAIEVTENFGAVTTIALFAAVGATNLVSLIPASAPAPFNTNVQSAGFAFSLRKTALVPALPWFVFFLFATAHFGVPVDYPTPYVIGVPGIILLECGLILAAMTVSEQTAQSTDHNSSQANRDERSFEAEVMSRFPPF
jgi:hypothetical protein